MAKKKREYVMTLIVVEGEGPFPIDMLRYASCVPHGEGDSRVIRDDPVGKQRVTLRRFSPDGRPTNVERWRSFGWTVLSDEGC